MRSLPRAARVAGLALTAFVVLSLACWPLLSYVYFSGYWCAEQLDLLTRGAVGAMQIQRRYFSGPPAWVRFVIDGFAGFVTFGPAAAVALTLLARQWLCRRGTYCGGCGERLEGLREPRCPHCGKSL